MLKPLVVTVVTALVQLALVSTTTNQIATAAIVSESSEIGQDHLIVKEEKAARAHINARQQSNINSIHQAITQFYRGLNEFNVDRMARVTASAPQHEKDFLRRSFARARENQVDISVEVKNIELISLSERNAVVEIDQLMTARGPGGMKSGHQSSSMILVKYHGQWKIQDWKTKGSPFN